jgi:hypothetical protein
MMAVQLFNESGPMQETDIPDIFDVLEGGEDESAVKFLLGFSAEDGEHVVMGSNQHHQQQQQLMTSATAHMSTASGVVFINILQAVFSFDSLPIFF